MQVGLREANMHFSKYIKLVKKGREIVLTERGVPIAAIRPVAPKEDTMEDRLNALEENGILKRGSGQLTLPKPVVLPGKAVSSLIIDERNERL
ncbi:MAG: type II toxin-antitoxin system prevent-host-death family antitoxin [Deltaproteobacteria bacterium]|nr:type II toxin-antitoxin system prevent-host-death family antitoxin [Deltaproteobacteria bacterium]